MLKLSDRTKQIIEKANLAFLCVFLIYTIFREVIPTDIFVGSSILSYLAFGGCLVMAFINFISDRDFIKTPNLIIFSLFMGVSAVSVLINRAYTFSSNINALMWMSVFLFYIYPAGRNVVFNNGKHKKILLSVTAVTLYILTAVSVAMYYFDVDYTFYKTEGTLTNQGFSNKYVRLWGVFQEANYGAICALIGLIIAIYLFINAKKVLPRILLFVAGITFFSFVVLSGSRTALLVSVMGCVWAAFYAVFTRLGKSTVKKLLFSGIACILAVSLYLGAFYGLKTILPYTKSAVLNMTSYETYAGIHKAYDSFYRIGKVNIIDGFFNESETSEDSFFHGNGEADMVIKLERPDLGEDKDISNGRLVRWKDGFSIFLSSPLFGASPRGIYEFAQAHNPDTTMAKYYYSISNTYLEILAGTGIAGFFVLLLMLIRTIFVAFIKKLTDKADNEHIFMSLIVLIPALAAVLQTDLFFNLTFSGTIFWLILGYLFRNVRNNDFSKIRGKRQ